MGKTLILLLITAFMVKGTSAQNWQELNDTALDLFYSGDYYHALSYAENAKKQAEVEFGKSHSNYGLALNNLAFMHAATENYETALPLYLESLDNIEKTLGVEHPDYGVRIFNLAELYRQMGNHDAAMPLLLETIAHAEKHLGKESAQYGIRLNNLAVLYQSQGRIEEALPLFEHAIGNLEISLGRDHPEYGQCRDNLAAAYITLGQYQKAIPLQIEGIERSASTADELITRINNLGLLYQLNGEHENALIQFFEALRQTEEKLSKEHPFFVTLLRNIADLYQIMGQQAKAIELYLQALDYTKRGQVVDHYEYVIELTEVAELLRQLGCYEESLDLFLEALEYCQKKLGDNHPINGNILNDISGIYADMTKYENAIRAAQQSLDHAVKFHGEVHPNYGVRLNNLASLYDITEQYETAAKLYEQALAHAESTLGKDHPSYGTRLNNLAGVYRITGQYNEALTAYSEAIECTEKALGQDHPVYATRLNNLAGLYEILGKYENALSLYEQGIEILKINHGKNHPEYNTLLNNLAGLYLRLDQHSKAILLFQEAIENLNNDSQIKPGNGIIHNNLAECYHEIGEYDKALSLYQKSLELIENTYGKSHSQYGTALNNIGLFYKDIGQLEKSLTYLRAAKDNTEQRLGTHHAEYGSRLGNLALVYHKIGQNDTALAIYARGIDIINNTLGTKHESYGVFINNIALVYQSMGNYETAENFYLLAIENAKSAVGSKHTQYNMAVANLALLYAESGRQDKAIPLYLEVLENTENVMGKGHATYGLYLNNFAGMYEALCQYNLSLPLYIEAISNKTKQIENAFSYLADREKELFVKTVELDFDVYQSFFTRYSTEKPQVAAHAFDIELATKGIILHSGIQTRQAIMSSGDEQALAIYEEWSLLRTLLAKQYSLPIAKRRSDIKEVEEKAEKSEAELSRLSAAFRGGTLLTNVRWRDVQNALLPGEVAIEFASFDFRNNTEWTDSTLYIALVLGKEDDHPHLVPLFEQQQLDSLLDNRSSSDESFVASLYRGATLVFGGEPTNNYGQRLYELVWQPIEKYVPKGSTVYFAPSGSLHQLAFAAIPAGENQLLSDRYQLQQLSSTAMLLREQKNTSNIPQSIALFGGIQYEVENELLLAQADNIQSEQSFSRSLPEDIDRGNTNWTYLPGTLREVNSIAAIAQSNNISTQSFTENAALEEQVKALAGAQSPEVLHIATHGFFFPDPKQEKRDNFQTLGEDRNIYRASDNPLQRAGLLFAGANRAWRGEPIPEGLDDGILTAYEVSHLYLGNTQLVVLSACETGLGDIKGSEGVFGLQRAFKQAGAEYLLMSLWKVPDNETAEFMEYFYEQWFAGNTIPNAFKATQNHMKQRHSNEPFKWAAFALVR